MPMLENIQPTCACTKPVNAPHGVSGWPACGECGSPSLSENAWCLRWSVTHCVSGPWTVMQPRIASVALTPGPDSKLLWEK